MSDAPQGPGWWQASDDKWYPPPRPEMPGEEAATEPVSAAPPGAPATAATPSGGYGQQPPPTTPYGTPGAPMPGAPGAPGAPGVPPTSGGYASPYAGMPPTTPPSGGDNRTPLFVALGVLATAALVGLILVVSSGDDGGDPPTSSSTTVDSTETTEGTETTDGPDTTEGSPPPSGDGELALGDQNFTISFDQLSEQDRVSYGFMVENTGDQVAVGLSATIAFKDDQGTVIGTDEELVNVILPGAAFGIGDAGIEVDGEPTEMEVTLSEPTSWESPDDFGEITASGINTTIDDWGAPTTSFTAESTYDRQLDSPYAYVIYRNSAGEIVGGAWSTMQFLQPNGNTTGEVMALYTIDNIDDSQTEVYIDAGFF